MRISLGRGESEAEIERGVGLPVLRSLTSYRDNWRILRSAVNAVGAEVEQWPYEVLDRDAERQPVIHRQIGEAELYFCIERWQKESDGDLKICIDSYGLPTLLAVKPSFQFAKRLDGSIYYP